MVAVAPRHVLNVRRRSWDAEFRPRHERLALDAAAPGELLFPGVWMEPVNVVVEALHRYQDARTLVANLPDESELGDADA